MRKAQILARLRAIQAEIDQPNADVDALTQEVRTLRAELSQIETREQLFQGINFGDQGGTPVPQPEQRAAIVTDPDALRATPEYRSAWLHRLQGRALNADESRAFNAVVEQRAYSTGGSSAGAAVPTSTMNQIVTAIEQLSALYALVTHSNIPGNIKVPKETAAAAASWHTENASISEGTNTLGYVELAGYELVKLVSVSIAARTMAIDAFEAYIVQQIARKMAIAIESAIISGTGSGQPTGILTGVTFGDTNSLTYAHSGSPSYDNLMDMCALLPSGYHPGAIWTMSTKTLYQKIRKLKDSDGKPLFTTNAADAFGGFLDGKRVIANDRVTDGTILLLSPAYYHWNTSHDITIDISNDSGFRNATVDYRGYALMDGKPLLDEAFIKLTEAAS